jgi:GAF domain-containing protein
MTLPQTFEPLLREVRSIADGAQPRDEKLAAICSLLKTKIPHYHWVGFYLVDPTRARELALGPFVGAPTEHTHIAFGQGICGQAADTGQTFLIQDVSQETNYLSCSPDVRSEIVVPILKEGAVVGELDIDSHALAPFTEHDRLLLEQIAAIVAALF